MNKFDEDKKIYLTSSIIFYDDCMYYEDDNKYIKITTKNWSECLEEYGWELINE